ncbi:AbrB/MazE/SpoVT family DNA-binding domain-containing protein [Convivina intestini]|uniref:SpoVT-AbrB domain-containing protein n=1 Tax=Convivina intestini TaxID=1505726 RepID=A0A2U1D9A6_9LACO|nr:AbrB/MazE/SpoVT family DNA-binding domain-containing protein [Convivina intestini]PVY84266.1 hypothetical protein C7384_1048 [Convivina intestini]CAH1855330.1 hypothetical protein R077811_01027 [Convivina intestini]SDB93666.1 hypothetical protein SAMN05216341_1068 [Leuconostocaceae bacterium R-53105]
MSKDYYQINVPKSLLEKLGITQGEEVEITLKNKAVSITRPNQENQSEDISIRWFLFPSLISTTIFLLVAYYQQRSIIPLTGSNSIATSVFLLGEISGMVGFIWTHVQQTRQLSSPEDRRVAWRLTPTLIIAFATMQAFITIGTFWAIGYLFQNASFDLITATILFFMFISISNFLMIYSALLASTTYITALLVLTIVGGVLVSMVTNSQLLWWQHNFSFLGTNQAQFSWTFNATLMISGLIWITLIDYLFVPIQQHFPKNWRLITLRALLTLDALSLACIGAIPNNQGLFHILHDSIANCLILFTAIPMIGLKVLLPNATKEFVTFSYLTAGGMAIAMTLFYIIRYLSLTAFEIIALALAISWLLLLMQHIHKLFQTDIHSYFVRIE